MSTKLKAQCYQNLIKAIYRVNTVINFISKYVFSVAINQLTKYNNNA